MGLDWTRAVVCAQIGALVLSHLCPKDCEDLLVRLWNIFTSPIQYEHLTHLFKALKQLKHIERCAITAGISRPQPWYNNI